MFKVTGNTPCESEFFDARIKSVLSFKVRYAAVSSALTLALDFPFVRPRRTPFGTRPTMLLKVAFLALLVVILASHSSYG
ncbi:hypothetical protein KA005_52740, partial [bacterium]|nr:hypothetical protein [bacterium]